MKLASETIIIIAAIFVSTVSASRSLSGAEVTSILDEKLAKYDKRVRPNQGGKF